MPCSTLIPRYHSLTSEMTPSRHFLNWLRFLNSNYGKLQLPRFQLRLQRSFKAHALMNHPNRPGRQPLVSAAPSKRRHQPHHGERDGIRGTHEGSPSPAPLETRFWQRMRTHLPRHSGHPRYRYMFIKLTNIPTDRKITYGNIVCDYKFHKKEKECVRLTVGSDRLDYSGDVATSTADITTFKILINSTLSTEDASMMMM
jgi:hypothetical protein